MNVEHPTSNVQHRMKINNRTQNGQENGMWGLTRLFKELTLEMEMADALAEPATPQEEWFEGGRKERVSGTEVRSADEPEAIASGATR